MCLRECMGASILRMGQCEIYLRGMVGNMYEKNETKLYLITLVHSLWRQIVLFFFCFSFLLNFKRVSYRSYTVSNLERSNFINDLFIRCLCALGN